jgi:hypothetical protein
MEDLKDIIVGKNFKWEGNLEEDDTSKVRVYFKVINSEYVNDKYNIFVEIDKIAAKNEGYYSHINTFCNSGKDAINDREYLQIIAGIVSVIKEQFSQFGEYSINVKSLNCSDIPQNITEAKKDRLPVRNVVKDLIKVFKENGEGVYALPEYFGTTMEYHHPNIDVYYSVELDMVEDVDSNDIYIDGSYYPDEELLIINLRYNPENKMSYISELIGELNEIIAHEFTHMRQSSKGDFDDMGEEPELPYDYYTQPHELEAQFKGFKRQSKLKKEPVSDVMDKWFTKYKERHRLSDEEVQQIKSKILSNY